MIEIILNGTKIKTSKGKTILDVATENGVHIPTLCHDIELKPFGSCWTCAVQVKDRRGFVTACGTKLVDGMEIFTETDEVKNARKMALELLLSDHYADCEAPCKLACPDQVDIQSYLALIANGQHHEAVKVIKETLPMPLSIGRVCPAFCEEECRRAIVDEPIAIRQLKRHAADFDLNDDWSYISQKKEATGQKVAIIGGGPSGLTCGYYLSNEGHVVTVYEAAPEAGGWLRYGIPEYRLPKAILDKEIELMCANGMQIKCNQEIGKKIGLSKLSKDYDAVYLAIGAQKAVPMRVKGSDLAGCFLGVDFLKDLTLGKKMELGNVVAIVGGGNTAIDCARTAKRLGKDVTLIYRRTRVEMPAEAYEVDAAEEEGVKFHFLTNPVENVGKNDKLYKIKLEKMELGEPDASGRRRPVGTGKFFNEKYDAVIAAISQTPEIEFLAEKKNKINGKEFPLSRWNTAESAEDTMYCGYGNVFAGGDFRRGPATAIEAIADGRIAARSINHLLNGEMLEEREPTFNSKKAEKLADVDPKEFEQYEKKARALMPEMDPKERATSFEEVETGFDEEAAREEAARCLECGCNVNTSCDLRKYSTEYKIQPEKFLGFENKHPIDDSHPFIRRDANKCIKCGRCVRICAEVQGPGVLGYIYRGFTSYVAPEFGESLKNTDCNSCGKCIEVCPVGALLPKNATFKVSPHITETFTQNCGLCGTGCKIDVETLGNEIVEIKPAAERGFNGRNLCFSGKFGWQVFEQNRLVKPYYRHNTHWHEMDDIDEAIDKITTENETAKTRKIYVSPVCTNEELLIMKQVAKNIGADISSLSYERTFEDKLRNTSLDNTTYQDLKEADTIVVVGQISKTLQAIIRAEQRKGKRLIVISRTKTNFSEYADLKFDEDPLPETLEKIIEYYCEVDDCLCGEEECVCDQPEEIELDLPVRTVFVYSRDEVSEETSWNVWVLASIIADFKAGSGVLSTSDLNNLRGFTRMGLSSGKPQYADFVILYSELPCEEQKKIVKNSKFIVTFNSHLDEADPAHIVMPKPSYLEMQGTAIANDGRISHFRNPKQTPMLQNLLNRLAELNMLDIKQASVEYWKNEVKHILDKPIERVEMTTDELYDFLCTIDKIQLDAPKQHSVQKHLILQLKRTGQVKK